MFVNVADLVKALTDNEVRFVVIGGVALVLQGSSRTTQDLDICYERTDENLERLAAALSGLEPRLRGAPPDLPFQLDSRTLRSGLNFTLTTTAGDLDLLGEVSGVGGYEEAVADADQVELYGRRLQIMSLPTLEKAKRAAGRLKDLSDLEIIQRLKDLES